VMSAIRDITERKRFETAFEREEHRAGTGQPGQGCFLAAMSHELRTPLNAVIGFTGTLLMKLPGPLNTGQEQQLKTVQSSAEHLLSHDQRSARAGQDRGREMEFNRNRPGARN